MKARGLGRVYQPTYTDKKTRETKTSAVWWIAYSFRGQKHREPSGSRNRADAVRLLKRRLAEMGQGRLVGPDIEKTTFEDLARTLLDDYRVNGRKSLETAEGSIKALRAFFGPLYARDLTLDRLNAYVVARLDAGRKPATIRNDLALLKRAFHLAERAGKAICPPFPTIRVQNARQGFFEESEFQAVLKHLPEDLRPLVEFGYLTGWRLDEVLGLQWPQIDFDAPVTIPGVIAGTGIVRLEPGTTKNDEGRVFPFAVLPELEMLLRTQRARTTALERATGQIIPFVFHRNGKAIKSYRGAWATACIAAGFFRVDAATGEKKPTKLPFHDFRRTAVRNLERAGVPRSVAMKLTGHKTESIYRRYAIVSERDLAEGVVKLAALRTVVRSQAAAGPVVTLDSARAERTGKVRAKSGAVCE
jgi:integrase